MTQTLKRAFSKLVSAGRSAAVRHLGLRDGPTSSQSVDNPTDPEPSCASGAVLWTDPLIIYTTLSLLDSTSYMRVFASQMPSDPACFLIYLSWSFQAGSMAVKAGEDLARFREAYPQHEIVILCNEQSEVEAFQEIGEPALLINHNITVSEQFFFPIDGSIIGFDAVYNARFAPEKRIGLAARIDRVAYITRQIHSDDRSTERQIFSEVERLKPRHRIINPIKRGQLVPLTVEAVNLVYNRAAVGLCLSAVEGAMLSSIEYLLAGLPIVSVPNRGGRDMFFDPEYCLTVEPDAHRIRDAVETLKGRRIPRDLIRGKTLVKTAAQRQYFIALVNQRLERAGVERRLSGPWPWAARRNLMFWGSLEDHLHVAAEQPPTSVPVAEAERAAAVQGDAGMDLSGRRATAARAPQVQP